MLECITIYHKKLFKCAILPLILYREHGRMTLSCFPYIAIMYPV